MNPLQHSAAEHDPQHSDRAREAKAAFKQGFQAHQKGNIDQAMAFYSRSIAILPTAEAHTFLGWAYSHKNDLERAIAECRTAISLDPNYGNPYNDMGAYLMELGRYDEAEVRFQEALHASHYETPFFSRFNLGRLFQRQGKWFEAVEEYKEAYKLALSREVNYDIARMAGNLVQAALN
jgi:Tfp pilus assembly protein PilF